MTATETSRERFADVGGGITLCYETFGDPADPPLLLVMGLGMQLLGWDARFCSMLAERGFHVVRFDNRDAGLSTSVDAPVPGLRQLATRRFDARQYDLGDMAGRRGRPAARAGPGPRPRGGRLAGRHGGPDHGGPQPGQRAHADVDHVHHGPPAEGPARSQPLPLPAAARAARARGLHGPHRRAVAGHRVARLRRRRGRGARARRARASTARATRPAPGARWPRC